VEQAFGLCLHLTYGGNFNLGGYFFFAEWQRYRDLERRSQRECIENKRYITKNNAIEKAASKQLIPFRLEAAAFSASLPGRVKSFIFMARPLVAHPVKG